MADNSKTYTALEAARLLGKAVAEGLEKATPKAKKSLDAHEARETLAKAVKERIAAFEGQLADLRKKELEGLTKAIPGAAIAAHAEPGMHEPEGSPNHPEPGLHEKPMAPVDPTAAMPAPVAEGSPAVAGVGPGGMPTVGPVDDMCPTCGNQDAPGSCTCLGKAEKDTQLCGHAGCSTTVDKSREYCTMHTKGSASIRNRLKKNIEMSKSELCKSCGKGKDACKCMAKDDSIVPTAGGDTIAGVTKGELIPESKKSPKTGSGGEIKGNPLKKDVLPPNNSKAGSAMAPPGTKPMAAAPKMGPPAAAKPKGMKPPAPPAAPGMKGSTMGVDTAKAELEKAGMPHPGYNATGMKTAMTMDPKAGPPAVAAPAPVKLPPMGAGAIRAKLAHHASRAATFQAHTPPAATTGHPFKPTGEALELAEKKGE